MAEILVLEDDESMNEVLVRCLAGLGHQVSAAFNADEALELCLSHNFSLVVTDIILPGQDGIECLARIKSMQGDVRCIAITGYARQEIPERAILLKVDDYLLKPFSMKSFLTAVTQVLDVENEQAKRQALLERLAPTAAHESNEDIQDAIVRRRDTIRALYVATRSKFFSRAAAEDAYVRIEAVELPFRKMLMADAPDMNQVSKLRGIYAKIYQGIVYSRSSPQEEEPRPQSDLTTEQFSRLHDNLLTSALGLHDLEYAPLLRLVSDSRLKGHPELLELKKLLWP